VDFVPSTVKYLRQVLSTLGPFDARNLSAQILGGRIQKSKGTLVGLVATKTLIFDLLQKRIATETPHMIMLSGTGLQIVSLVKVATIRMISPVLAAWNFDKQVSLLFEHTMQFHQALVQSTNMLQNVETQD